MRLKGTLSMLGPPGKWTGSAVFCATLTKSMLEFSFSQTPGGGEGHGSLACCSPGVGDGQGGLACCDSWDRKESDTTERLN